MGATAFWSILILRFSISFFTLGIRVIKKLETLRGLHNSIPWSLYTSQTSSEQYILPLSNLNSRSYCWPTYLWYDTGAFNCCFGRLIHQLSFLARPMNELKGVSLTVFDASRTFKPSGESTTTPQWVHFDIVPNFMYGLCDDWLSMKTISPTWRSLTVLLSHDTAITTTIIAKSIFLIINSILYYLCRYIKYVIIYMPTLQHFVANLLRC